jgi:chromosomal replication initiation ATPase DnaA
MTQISQKDAKVTKEAKAIDLAVLLRDIRAVINRHLGEEEVEAIPTDIREQMETIISRVAAEYKMDVDIVRRKNTRRRSDHVAWPRFVACFFCRELTPASLMEIGDMFNNYDHGSVIHACRQVQDQVDIDAHMRMAIERMRGELKQALNIDVAEVAA